MLYNDVQFFIISKSIVSDSGKRTHIHNTKLISFLLTLPFLIEYDYR